MSALREAPSCGFIPKESFTGARFAALLERTWPPGQTRLSHEWLVARCCSRSRGRCRILVGRSHDGATDWSTYFVLTMTLGMVVGLWAWGWRPKTRMGPLMFWWPALWLAADLPAAFPESSPIASTVGVALFVFGPIVFAQMALSIRLGTLLPGRLAWFYIFVLAYAAQVVQNIYTLLYLGALAGCLPPRVPTLFHVQAGPPIAVEVE